MRTAARRAAGTLVVASGVILLRPGTPANRVVRRQLEAAARRLRYLGGRIQGISYRLRGRHPDPDVIDSVLADRVRSSLGGLERRLDLPHIHALAENHVVLLHGEVASDADAAEIERAVAGVSGVAGVESYLHVGLSKGDTRPSEGRAVHAPSPALRALVDAGTPTEAAAAVVRGILATVADRIPEGERSQVAAHLPADVRPLFSPPRRARGAAPARSVHELVARVAATTAELPREQVDAVVASVVQTLRTLVPEEAGDGAATLPAELRALWQGQPTATPADGPPS